MFSFIYSNAYTIQIYSEYIFVCVSVCSCVDVVVCMVSRKEPGFLTVPAALRELSHCALKVGPQGRASKLNGSVVGRVSSTVEARFGAYQCLCVCVCACRSRL